MPAVDRIRKEIKDMLKSKDPNITANVDGSDITHWRATIKGPKDTPYEGGVYNLRITLPQEYPFQPPKIMFDTKIYHCNISSQGHICLDILKDGWSPALTIEKTLLSLISLLEHPNPNDPLEPNVAREMKVDGMTFLRKATEITKKYAMPIKEEENENENEDENEDDEDGEEDDDESEE